MMEGIIL